jgi:hypothetical protein
VTTGTKRLSTGEVIELDEKKDKTDTRQATEQQRKQDMARDKQG